MNWLRVFVVGGLTGYRAQFSWLNPWVYVPMLIVQPLFQLLFFAYLGRATGTETDTFFVVGNALIALTNTGLFGVAAGIAGERWTQTLGTLLSSPASRLALFLGRAWPAILNGFVVCAFCLIMGRLLLDFHPGRNAIAPLALAIVVSAFATGALGIVVGAFGLRGRNLTALNNLLLALLLLFTGAEVPLGRFPGWIQTLSAYLPLTHGIRAAREIVDGASLGDVSRLLALEGAVGLAYGVAGAMLLKVFEYQGRRTAALETF